MRYILHTIMLVVILSGCGRVPVMREFSDIKKRAKSSNNIDISWPRAEHTTPYSLAKSEDLIAKGLTRQQAVEIALERNPGLQAKLEELGISTANLVDAGLLTNPVITTGANWEKNRHPNDENQRYLTAELFLSDAWNVPAQYAVAKDELEITKYEIELEILELTKTTKKAYNDCIFAHENLLLTQDIVRQMKEIRTRIKTSSKKISQFDVYYLDVTIGRWEVDAYKAQFLYKRSLINLRKQLNLDMSFSPMNLKEDLELAIPILPVKELENEALTHQPSLKKAVQQIERARHTITLEKARISTDLTITGGFSKDADGTSNRAFQLAGSIPIFNPKQARIIRARHTLYQTQQQYDLELITIKNRLFTEYAEIERRKNELKIFKKTIIPSAQKATREKVGKAFGLESITAIITAYVDLYQVKRDRISSSFNLANTYNDLEQTIGKSLFQ